MPFYLKFEEYEVSTHKHEFNLMCRDCTGLNAIINPFAMNNEDELNVKFINRLIRQHKSKYHK